MNKPHVYLVSCVYASVSLLFPTHAHALGKEEALTIYSSRSQALVEPLIDLFRHEVKYEVNAQYGTHAVLMKRLLRDGLDSPADVYLAEDAGALVAMSNRELFSRLPGSTLNLVASRFRSGTGHWVGLSGRVRALVYNTQRVKAAERPSDIHDLCDVGWKGRVGWVPGTSAFQTFVRALRVSEGAGTSREWLTCMTGNGTRSFNTSSALIAAVRTGAMDAGLVDHSEALRDMRKQGDASKVRLHFLPGGDAGTLVAASGVGILDACDNEDAAQELVDFLLAGKAQRYFVDKLREYPMSKRWSLRGGLRPLTKLNAPPIPMDALGDVEGTRRLLAEAGVL